MDIVKIPQKNKKNRSAVAITSAQLIELINLSSENIEDQINLAEKQIQGMNKIIQEYQPKAQAYYSEIEEKEAKLKELQKKCAEILTEVEKQEIKKDKEDTNQKGNNEIEYTEDFFRKAFGDDGSSLPSLKQTTQQGYRGITPEYSADDIDDNWIMDADMTEGQLAVDVFQTETEMVIQSAVAGVRAEDLDIDMNGDMITIRGVRRQQFGTIPEDDFFIRECFWGNFSRSIILPADIQHDQVNAALENGVLTIRLPKASKPRNGKISVVELTTEN